MMKSGFFHDIRIIILAQDHPTCVALPFFDLFSGCDTMSSVYSKGKCMRWDVWIKSFQLRLDIHLSWEQSKRCDRSRHECL